MSYVGDPFEIDVFQSYSHGSADANNIYRLKEWSVAFGRELQAELQQCMQAQFRLFLDTSARLDEGVSPLHELTPQIRQVGNAAVLVLLVSPQYIDSKWCSAERTWWIERQTELGIATDGRIAFVNILPTTAVIPDAPFASKAQDTTGFYFYQRAGADSAPGRLSGRRRLPRAAIRFGGWWSI